MAHHAVPRGVPGRSALRGSRGFTLVEIIVAMMILSVAVLGMASVLAGTSRRHETSVSHGELTAAAEGKLEELRSQSAAGIDVELAEGGSLTESQDAHVDSLHTAHGRWVLRRWTVADGPAGTLAVTVRVRPANTARNDHDSIDLSSLVVQP
jgi:prepilin-type N-terminal cleavage/methylation domain-containing protein